MPQQHKETKFPFEVLGLAIAAGGLFCAMHLLNGWLFAALEISPHISFLYLPSFLRLVNVLVLGMVWGTLGTAIGCALLIAWSPDNLLLSMANATIAASSAAMAVFLMRVMQKRLGTFERLDLAGCVSSPTECLGSPRHVVCAGPNATGQPQSTFFHDGRRPERGCTWGVNAALVSQPHTDGQICQRSRLASAF
jgi:hypothetical protein